MILSFADKATRQLWERQRSAKIDPTIHRVALRKLVQLHAATGINSLRVPPENRLEALKGDGEGQYSIRINDQWRICFTWTGMNAEDVEIVDDH